MNSHANISVMLVDDHPAFRVGMATLIEIEPDLQVIAQTGLGCEALELYRQYEPDVVLMDLRLPDLGGVEAIIALRKEFPSAQVIVLTTFDMDEDIFHATQSGARSYLLKDAPQDEVIAAIRAVHNGKEKLSERVMERLAARRLRPALSQRELDVLHQLAKGCTNKEIAAFLFISEDTVKSHVKNLFFKLNVKDRTEAVITAFRYGIAHL
jgi:DNA-binding NarL/FixJ family response regulator